MKTLFLFFTAFIFLVQLIPNAQQGSNLSVNNVQVAFPFSDDAEDTTTSYANWDRDAGVWQVKIVSAHSGNQAWVMSQTTGQYNYITLSSAMNLSSTVNPYVQFWARKSDGGGGYVSVEASSDGGSTWTALLQPNINGASYTRVQASLYNFRVNSVLIRIGGYAPYGSYYIDDILIDNAPTPQSFVLLNPTNNGMEVKWGQSTASDFGFYRIVLSTDQNVLNNDINSSAANGFYATTGVSGHGETRVFDITNKSTLDTVLTDLTFTNTQYYAKIYEKDTQELVNQGSDRADLATVFLVTTEVAPFTETFEGTYKWAADIPWAVTDADASDDGHSTTHAFEDSPDGNYPANADRRLVTRINFGTLQHPVLRFNQKYSYEAGYDYGYVEYSSDNTNWTTITGFTGNTGSLWETRDFDAGLLKGQTNGYIRFRTTSNGPGVQQNGWHLDDVEIYNNTRITAFPFFDDVSVDAVSQVKWIPGSWGIKIAGDHSGDSQVWALPQSGGQYIYLTLGGPINLSSAPNPYVQFWVKKSDNGGGYVSVEASNDDGITWHALIQPNINGASYTRVQASLYNYRQSNVLIRIGGYAPYGSYYVDDILIDNAPTPKSFVMLTPTNNGMKVKWGQSTASDFGFYRIVMSTDQNVLNNDINSSAANGFYAATGISGHGETRVFDISNKATLDTTLTDLTFTNTQYYAKIYEKDTQELVNQGSDRADLATTFSVTPEVAPFTETFEGTSYKWAADLPWAVTDADASDEGHSTTHAFEDSPEGNYPPNADRRLVVQMNLSSINRPMLMFNHKYAFEQGYDFGKIDVSTDNVNWTNITAFTGNSGSLWEPREFDLGAFSQQNSAYLRFSTTSNGPGVQQDGWHLDDIQIIDNLKTGGIPITDSVEVDSVSKGYWIPGIWEINIAAAHSGSQIWYCPPAGGGYNYITLNGATNLSSAPKPYVSFWIRKADGGGGYYSFEVSNDGGQTWHVILQPNINGNSYINGVYSLANYREPNVLFRIGVYSPYGAYYLDDITFADSTNWTGVEDLAGITPTEFELSQNYPNPFNPSTTIRYALPSESKVSITVFNLLGQEVATLVNDLQSAGYHEVVFNAAKLSSGVYLYTINAASSTGSKDFNSTKKLILLK